MLATRQGARQHGPGRSRGEGWGKIEAASVAHTLTASLSWQIGLPDPINNRTLRRREVSERSDFNYDLFAIEQHFLSREGELKNLINVKGAAREDISLLHFRLQKDEKVINENSSSISELHVRLSCMSSHGNPKIVLDGQVHELQSQVQTLSTKLALVTELAEKDQR